MTTAPRYDLSDIKAMLQAQIDGLVAVLCPDGYRSGRNWLARNPRRADNSAGSFVVWLQGAAIGSWKDYATGDKGDVINLITYCNGFDNIGSTMAWARDWLGLERMDRAEIDKARARLERNRKEGERERLQQLEKDRRYAFTKWLKAERSLAGTLAERYLARRGIPLADLPHEPHALRYLPTAPNKDSGQSWPCLIALMQAPEGDPREGAAVALHRTWLARDGSDKAPLAWPAGSENARKGAKPPKPRKVWPAASGLVIKLARGETNLGPDEAARRGLWDRLVLCEGIEDGLSIALACPQYRVWAAYSLTNLARVQLPACCGEVIVAADNDWGKPQAEAQLSHALDALHAQGRPVKVARSHIGKDANDALRRAR